MIKKLMEEEQRQKAIEFYKAIKAGNVSSIKLVYPTVIKVGSIMFID